MRSMSTLSVGAAVALTSLSATAAMPKAAPPPSGGSRRAPTPPYERKVPETAYNFARLEAAERKRARKAEKLRAR